MTLTVPPSDAIAARGIDTGVRTGFLGVVMRDMKAPRLPGDMGHPYAFGVLTSLLAARGARTAKEVQSVSKRLN